MTSSLEEVYSPTHSCDKSLPKLQPEQSPVCLVGFRFEGLLKHAFPMFCQPLARLLWPVGYEQHGQEKPFPLILALKLVLFCWAGLFPETLYMSQFIMSAT